MNRKLKKCSTCGADIAKTAKTCPQCGAKNVDLLPFWGMASVVLAIFLIFIAKDMLNKDTEKPSNNSEVPYQDVIKTFSDLHDDADISVKEINDRLGVVITCNDLNSSSAPENWDKMISNFTKYLEKGNKLADKYGLKILTAEIRAADGTVLASGGNGECTFDIFQFATSDASSQDNSNGGIVLGPGTYVVGEDIDAGKYDCFAVSGFGVFRGEVASAAPAGFVQTMGDATVTVGGETAGVKGSTSYSNLTLTNGDVLYIEMSLNVEFVKK